MTCLELFETMRCSIVIAFQLCFRVCPLSQVNQNGLKLNGTHQPLVYADDVNILGGSVLTLKKNTKVFIVASNEPGLE
jgi:hypothetical protein